jgi:hypothetical protein
VIINAVLGNTTLAPSGRELVKVNVGCGRKARNEVILVVIGLIVGILISIFFPEWEI